MSDLNAPQQGPESNGKPEYLPTIAVLWDEKHQAVRLEFDPKEFRTWAFVGAVMDMAAEFARVQQRFVEAEARQRKQQEQAAAQALRKGLGL